MAEYRLGHFPAAIEWAQRILPPDETTAGKQVFSASVVQAYMILAMAQQRLGNAQQAGEFLGKGIAFANAKMVDHSDLSWNEQLIARTLMSEAKSLISDRSEEH